MATSEDYNTSKPKKYLIFGFLTYYPSGGMEDLLDESFDTIEEAVNFCSNIYRDTFQIVDRDTWKVVKEI